MDNSSIFKKIYGKPIGTFTLHSLTLFTPVQCGFRNSSFAVSVICYQ